MTARENITRALRHVGLIDLVDIVVEAEDRVFCAPSYELRGAMVERGWIRDPVAPGAYESWRESGAVVPCLRVCFLRSGVVDISLDFATPLGGSIASAMVHLCAFFWYLLTRAKSHQWRMKKALDRRFGKEMA